MEQNFKEDTARTPETAELPEMHNLVGFFELLLKVDKRVNPHNYLSHQRNQE